MVKLKSTFGLHAGKLSCLFGLGTDQDTQDSATDEASSEAGLLQERLSEHLSTGLWSSGMLPRQWERFDRTMDSILGPSLRELLIGSDTDPAVLRQVKDHAARLSNSAPSRGHKQVANVLYYAAIASALLHHDHLLTEFSPGELHNAYTTLAQVPWVTPELAQLFAATAGVCTAGREPSGKETRPDG